jgi:hypothetical protein
MNQPRLLDQVRDALRVRHYSIRTEETYLMKYIPVFPPAGQPAAVQIYILSSVSDTSMYHSCS